MKTFPFGLVLAALSLASAPAFADAPTAAPNNYRIDRVSGAPSVIARSSCDEAIQGPQHARRQQPTR